MYSTPRNIDTGQAPCTIRKIENNDIQLINIIPKIKKTDLEQL